MQEIAAPPFAGPGYLRQLVADTGRDQDPPRRQLMAAVQTNDEPGPDPQHLILEQLDSRAGDLGPPRGQEVSRRHPVTGQEPLHVSRGSVARRSGIHDSNLPSSPA